MDHLLLGLSVALQPENLLYALIGAILGTVVGVLPGIGTMAVIAMLLPFTYLLSPIAGIIMLAGIYYGAQYGGNTSAILLGIPGESSAAVSVYDGYPMAKKGRGGAALAISALSSFFAGTIATIAMFLSAPLLGKLALSFGSAEYTLLILLGLMGSISFSEGALLKGVGMMVAGLLISTIGMDPQTGMSRFDFGWLPLRDGIHIAIIAMGIFGLAEVFEQLTTKESPNQKEWRGSRSQKEESEKRADKMASPLPLFAFGQRNSHQLYPTKAELKSSLPAASRGTVIGILLGVFPGIGATVASFAAYAFEKRVNPRRRWMGSGEPAGLAAPEAANNAAAQTSFIPLLTLGIPGSVVVALMMGALMVHNIQPGPNLMNEHPDLFFGVIASMWIGNLILLFLNLPLIGLWVRLLTLPKPILLPIVLISSTLGVYLLNGQVSDLFLLLIFGLLGLFMRRFDCPTAPFILGVILGPLLEEHGKRALLLADGDLSIFTSRPISLILLILLILIIGQMLYQYGRQILRKYSHQSQ